MSFNSQNSNGFFFALEMIFMIFFLKDTSNIDYSQYRRVKTLVSHGIHVSHIYEVKSSRLNIRSMEIDLE